MFEEVLAIETAHNPTPDSYWYTTGFAAIGNLQEYPDATALRGALKESFEDLALDNETREKAHELSEQTYALLQAERLDELDAYAPWAALIGDNGSLPGTTPDDVPAERAPLMAGPAPETPAVPDVLTLQPAGEADSDYEEIAEGEQPSVPFEIAFDDGNEKPRASRRPRIGRAVAGIGLVATTIGSSIFIKDGYPYLAMRAVHTSAALVDSAITSTFGSSEFLDGSVGVAAAVAVTGLARWAWKDHLRYATPDAAPKHRAPRFARSRALRAIRNTFRMPADDAEYDDLDLGIFS